MVFTCTRALSSSTNLNNSTVLFWWGWFTTKRYTVSSKKKKKQKQLNFTSSLQQFVEHSQLWAASSTEHVLRLVPFPHGSSEAKGQVPKQCKMLLHLAPDLQLLFSWAHSTGNCCINYVFATSTKEERNYGSILVPKPLDFAVWCGAVTSLGSGLFTTSPDQAGGVSSFCTLYKAAVPLPSPSGKTLN